MSKTTAPKNKAAKKVLVVEDEGEMGLLLNMMLNEKKFELDYVNNLESADEYLQKEEPSVLSWIINYRMDLVLILLAISRKNIQLSRSS
jgi:DNA-binding response OmpR family regulator